MIVLFGENEKVDLTTTKLIEAEEEFRYVHLKCVLHCIFIFFSIFQEYITFYYNSYYFLIFSGFYYVCQLFLDIYRQCYLFQFIITYSNIILYNSIFCLLFYYYIYFYFIFLQYHIYHIIYI